MQNNRMYGIVFQKGSNCGIAKITVKDTTTNKWITSTGVSSDTLVYRLYDTYLPSSGYKNSDKVCTYKISLVVGHAYSITVEHSGTHNASASSPYNINILRYLESNPWVNSSLKTTVHLRHDNYPTEISSIVLNENNLVTKQALFNGDGSNRVFVLSGSNRASAPYRFSPDGGTTWLYPYSMDLTWGSNSPDFNDELIDGDHHYGANFDDPPSSGTGNVILEYYILCNKLKVERELTQPYYGDKIDYCNNINVLDDAIELI